MKRRLRRRHDAETAENVAEEFQVSREDQDAFALRSQEQAAAAQANGRFAAEIVAGRDPAAQGRAGRRRHATSIRARPRSRRSAKLKPIVRKDGTVTAGNASGVNDGAAALIVASEEAAKRNGLTPRARILGAAVAGVPPRIMGIGPAPATREAAGAARPQDRRHRRDRAERGLRRPGPRGAAPARPRRRRRRT